MHAVDADEARTAVRHRRPAHADGNSRRPGLGEDLAPGKVARASTQVVEVPHRDRRQSCVAGVAVAFQRPFHQMYRRRTGQGVVQRVRLGQQRHIQIGEFPLPAVFRFAVGLAQSFAVAPALDQTRHLLARVARRASQVAQDQPLVRLLQTLVAKPREHRRNVRVAPVLAHLRHAKTNLGRPRKKRPYLLQRRELCFVHVDHHPHDDRSRYPLSDSFPLGNPAPSSDSYHVGKDCVLACGPRCRYPCAFVPLAG
jgi:hypothetical protein